MNVRIKTAHGYVCATVARDGKTLVFEVRPTGDGPWENFDIEGLTVEPAPAPEPDAPPPPAPVDDLAPEPSAAFVARVKARLAAQGVALNTAAGAFEITKRVAWGLRASGAGLLVKNAGENIVPWNGRSFSASRLCYPDGHIYKLLSDVPTTNGPSWQDNDFVNPSLYVPAMQP